MFEYNFEKIRLQMLMIITKAYAHPLAQCFSNCGPWTTGGPRRFARWSSVVRRRFQKKKHCKNCIRSDTEQIKNTPIHICAKTDL